MIQVYSSQTYFAMCGIDVLWIIQTYTVMYDTGVLWSSQTYFAMCGIDVLWIIQRLTK